MGKCEFASSGEMVSPYERSVMAFLADPQKRNVVTGNYLDADFQAALDRYATSEEFIWLKATIAEHGADGFRVVELGAGRGLVSFALARQGIPVTSVEIDPSNVVGIGALARYVSDHRLPVSPTRADVLQLPFGDHSFDVVICRALLHHLADLGAGLREIFRVLAPGGRFVARAEHIVSPLSDRRAFLASHPAVAYGVNEWAYPVRTYRRQLLKAGFSDIVFKGGKMAVPFEEFVNATHRCNPVRSRAMRLPILGNSVARVFFHVHSLIRGSLGYLIVDERQLPAVGIVARKSDRKD